MTVLTEVQTIRDAKGRPAIAVVPFADSESLVAQARGARASDEVLLPHEVVSLMVDGASAARAWREHLGLTQAEVAVSMGISQAALRRWRPHSAPRKVTRAKLAVAMGLNVEQLIAG